MIILSAVIVMFIVALIAAVRLNTAVAHARDRFRVLAGGYGDAGLLVEARRRFRRRQRSVENAVDTGAVGLKSAHRTVSGLFGKNSDVAEGIYDNVRALNRNAGRAISGLFAPGPKKHSESLQDWRKRQRESDAPRDDER